jgi:hypothetical protein
MRMTTIPRIKGISLGKMRIRKRRLSALKQSFRLDGGPISRAWLCTPGTLCFQVGEWRGYYDGENKWVGL